MITFEREPLAKVISVAARAADGKFKEMYGMIKFEFEDEVCKITSSNGNITVQGQCPCSGNSDPFCVDAKMINRLVTTLTEMNITMEVIKEEKGRKVVLKAKRKKYTLGFYDPSNFIDVEIGELIGRREVGAGDFITALNEASPFTSSNDLRQHFQYIFIVSEGEVLRIFGTDTACFYMKSINSRGDGFENSLITPEVLGVIGNGEKGLMVMYETEKQTVFEISGMKIIMNKPSITAPSLLDKIAKYDDFSHVIVVAEELKSTLNRMQVFRSDETYSKVIFEVKGEIMLITSFDFRSGAQAEEEVEIKNNGVDDFQIGFNATAISRSIVHTEGDNISIYMKENNKPAIIKGSNDSVKTIAMPIMI